MLDAYTDDMALLQLARLVVTFYLTIALMGIGFAMMWAGPPGAGVAARFFFLRPLQSLLGVMRSASALVLGTMWAGLAAGISGIGRATWRELKELAADARWLARRFDR